MPSASTLSPFSAPGLKFAAQRLLGFGPAEHAALRGAGHRHAHAIGEFRHEHRHQREARRRLDELLIGRAPGIGNFTSVMISPSSSAVVNMPWKKSSAAISRRWSRS